MYSAEKQDGDAPPPDAGKIIRLGLVAIVAVSYTHLTLPTKA